MKIYEKLILNILAISLIGCTAPIQEKQEVTITTNDANDRKMMLIPMGYDEGIIEMTPEGNAYRTTINTSPTGFYKLVSIKGQTQSIIPYYVPVTEAKSETTLTFGEKGAISMEGSDDNQALAAYLNDYVNYTRSLFASNANWSNPALVKGFITKADSIVSVYDCSDEVKEFLKIWSYIHTHNSYDLAARIQKGKKEEIPYKREDLLPNPYKIFDSPLATLFPEAHTIVYGSLPNRNNLDSALIYLDTHYTDTTLKAKVKEYLQKQHTAYRATDAFWMAALTERVRYHSDDMLTNSETLQQVTPKDVQRLARKLARSKHTVEVVMNP